MQSFRKVNRHFPFHVAQLRRRAGVNLEMLQISVPTPFPATPLMMNFGRTWCSGVFGGIGTILMGRIVFIDMAGWTSPKCSRPRWMHMAAFATWAAEARQLRALATKPHCTLRHKITRLWVNARRRGARLVSAARRSRRTWC